MNIPVSPPPIGDNSKTLSIPEVLSEDTEGLKRRVDALAERANAAPRKIKTPEDLAVVGKLVLDVKALGKEVEDTRTVAKEPYLAGGREVDSFFESVFGQTQKKPATGRLGRILLAFQKVADDYTAEKLAKEREERRLEAEKLRKEEEARLAAARKAEEDGRLKNAASHEAKAEAAAAAAEQAEAQAQASAASLVKTQTDSGLTASGKEVWEFIEITDFQAIPLDLLRPYLKRDAVEAAIRFAVRQGIHKIAGARIEQVVKASFR